MPGSSGDVPLSWLEALRAVSAELYGVQPVAVVRPPTVFTTAEELDASQRDYAPILPIAQRQLRELPTLTGDGECAAAVCTESGVILLVEGRPRTTLPRQWMPGARLFGAESVCDCVRFGGVAVLTEDAQLTSLL